MCLGDISIWDAFCRRIQEDLARPLVSPFQEHCRISKYKTLPFITAESCTFGVMCWPAQHTASTRQLRCGKLTRNVENLFFKKKKTKAVAGSWSAEYIFFPVFFCVSWRSTVLSGTWNGVWTFRHSSTRFFQQTLKSVSVARHPAAIHHAGVGPPRRVSNGARALHREISSVYISDRFLMRQLGRNGFAFVLFLPTRRWVWLEGTGMDRTGQKVLPIVPMIWGLDNHPAWFFY